MKEKTSSCLLLVNFQLQESMKSAYLIRRNCVDISHTQFIVMLFMLIMMHTQISKFINSCSEMSEKFEASQQSTDE